MWVGRSLTSPWSSAPRVLLLTWLLVSLLGISGEQIYFRVSYIHELMFVQIVKRNPKQNPNLQRSHRFKRQQVTLKSVEST